MAWFVKLALAKLGYGELTRKSNELQLIYSGEPVYIKNSGTMQSFADV
jgi:hypothetical protein